MCFFENDAFLTILRTFKHVTFPLLVPVVVAISENHWHKFFINKDFFWVKFWSKSVARVIECLKKHSQGNRFSKLRKSPWKKRYQAKLYFKLTLLIFCKKERYTWFKIKKPFYRKEKKWRINGGLWQNKHKGKCLILTNP